MKWHFLRTLAVAAYLNLLGNGAGFVVTGLLVNTDSFVPPALLGTLTVVLGGHGLHRLFQLFEPFRPQKGDFDA